MRLRNSWPLLFVLGCGVATDAQNSKPGKADLPFSDSPTRGYYDQASMYDNIQLFVQAGYDLERDDTEQLEILWPTQGPETKVVARFGTPDVSALHFHTAFDVVCSESQHCIADLVAPVSGYAIAGTWSAGQPSSWYYENVITFYDPNTHLLVQLMHVNLEQTFIDSWPQPVWVEQGQVVGTMAEWKIPHTHLSVADAGGGALLDPAHFSGYQDSSAPQFEKVYLLDESVEQHESLVNGDHDVLVKVFDRDDNSGREFGVQSIAYEIVDDLGNVLRESERCRFSDLFESIATLDDAMEKNSQFQAAQLIDSDEFGNNRDTLWSIEDSEEYRLSYSLTQFMTDADGRCQLVHDDDGFIAIDDTIAQLTVRGTIWDQVGNTTEFESVIAR